MLYKRVRHSATMKHAFIVLLLAIVSLVSGLKGVGYGEQEWGHVKIREHAEMFWWLYYTTADVVGKYHERPLIIWLQGGPGESSTGVGNFMELGPVDMDLKPRNHTWVKDYNVLFVDNPVGTGFSHVDNYRYFTSTNIEIAVDLVAFMKEFYKIFPQFVKTPTYIVSESYGGKMTVEFAGLWYKEQQRGNMKSNLKGVALGSPWISPIHSVMEYAPYLFFTGMIDKTGHDKIEKIALSTKKAIEEGKWFTVSDLLTEVETAIFNETNTADLYNILTRLKPSQDKNVYGNYGEKVNKLAYLMNVVVKKILNIDKNRFWGETGAVVSNKLSEEFMKPATRQVEFLLNETDIYVYIFNGQLDVAVNAVGTLKWIDELQWHNRENWKSALRQPFIVNDVIEGFSKQFDKLKMFWINRAGHMATVDNPIAVNAVLKDLTDNSF